MIKVIAFREDGWLSPNTDFRMWDHLCRAYDVDLQMIRDWSEADIPQDAEVVVLDESGEGLLGSFAPSDNVVLVFGRSNQDLTVSVPYDRSVCIDTPNAISLFGVTAAAITLSQIRG